LPFSKTTVKSDSQYVIKIKERKEKLKQANFITKKGKEIQNKDLVIRLIKFIETIELEFIKVKAHQKKTNIRNYNIDVDKTSRKIVRNIVKEIEKQ